MSEVKVCPPTHRHGQTLNCYRRHKCRCDSCRARNAADRRAWIRSHRIEPDPYAVDLVVDGIPTLLSAEQRAEAVHRLWLQRWSDNAIADRIGVSDRTVLRIRHRNGWRGYQMWELQKTKEAA